MSKLEYEEIHPISRDDALKKIGSGIIADACRAIISVALHEDDWRWAQSVCLEATNHTEFEVKRSAITGLCHIVRIHQTIDLPLITPALKRLQKDPNLRGYVDNFFSDATVFYKSSGQH
jgi:hypothetical protein